jgi:cell division septum initiation protein DivIVA
VSAVDELVPLHTDFDLVWRGCDREQVRQYVARVETELRLLTVDRDAAVRRADALAEQLAAARAEVRALAERLDRVCRTPVDPGGLGERLRHMVELAHAEAEEITTRARAAAEQDRATAQQAADRLRRRSEYLVAELDRRRAELETEHRELMARAHERVETLTREAERRRRELDEQAAHLREQIQSDFELATAARRAETMRELAEERTAAQAEAERLVQEAERQANDMIANARREVDRLRAYRDRIVDGLHAARRTLAEAGPLLAPLPEETVAAENVVAAA